MVIARLPVWHLFCRLAERLSKLPYFRAESRPIASPQRLQCEIIVVGSGP